MKIGDVVQLKAGGPKMTVIAAYDHMIPKSVTCSWFDVRGRPLSMTFPVDALQETSP